MPVATSSPVDTGWFAPSVEVGWGGSTRRYRSTWAARWRSRSSAAELETNELNYRRQSDLRRDGLASQREFELAELASRQSEAKVASARAKLRAAQNKLSQSRAALRRVVAASDAEIANAEAGLRSAETEVASTSASLARLEVDIATRQFPSQSVQLEFRRGVLPDDLVGARRFAGAEQLSRLGHVALADLGLTLRDHVVLHTANSHKTTHIAFRQS